uniref:DUF4939 domain-containing protein n=1 Tax=Sinocyclocheilus anshuiensis TaxID=1608454 RepID=A0A671NIY6_9TELE
MTDKALMRSHIVLTIRISLLPIRTVTASPPACPMARPASFSGEAAFCSGFLLQCSLYLEMQPHLFVTERAKVSFIISLLSGRAFPWIHSRPSWTSSWDALAHKTSTHHRLEVRRNTQVECGV